MVTRKVAEPSRWVLQALWLIAAALLIAILVIRSKGLLTLPQQTAAGIEHDARAVFTLPLKPNAGPYSLDVLSWSGHVPVRIAAGAVVAVPPATAVTISGWAFDAAAKSEYPAIGGRISGSSQIFSAIVHLSRPDVAAAVGSAAQNSGFALTVDSAQLPPGRHTVAIRALSPDGHSAALLEPKITLNIASVQASTQHTDAIDAINGVAVNAETSATAPVAIQRSYGVLNVSGWGFVTSGRRLANSLTILVDGNPAGAARYGLPRADVARQFNDVRVTRSGFEAALPMNSLTAGAHEIGLQFGLSDGTTIPSSTTLHIVLQ